MNLCFVPNHVSGISQVINNAPQKQFRLGNVGNAATTATDDNIRVWDVRNGQSGSPVILPYFDGRIRTPISPTGPYVFRRSMSVLENGQSEQFGTRSEAEAESGRFGGASTQGILRHAVSSTSDCERSTSQSHAQRWSAARGRQQQTIEHFRLQCRQAVRILKSDQLSRMSRKPSCPDPNQDIPSQFEGSS